MGRLLRILIQVALELGLREVGVGRVIVAWIPVGIVIGMIGIHDESEGKVSVVAPLGLVHVSIPPVKRRAGLILLVAFDSDVRITDFFVPRFLHIQLVPVQQTFLDPTRVF